jgi:hypothetical protein
MNPLRKDPIKVAYDQGRADAAQGRQPMSVKSGTDEIADAYKEGFADELLAHIRRHRDQAE